MKLSLFFITTVLCSIVAATPVIVPRAPSPSFQLGSPYSPDLPPTLRSCLQVPPIPELGYPGYYKFGWFTPAATVPGLYFPDDMFTPGCP